VHEKNTKYTKPAKSQPNCLGYFRVFRVFRGFRDRMNLAPYRDFTIELARASGDFIRPLFGRREMTVELKADQTPVTQADRGAEELMRRMIKARFPRHGLLGEEFGSENADAEFVWVIDPIDGTKSFISGVPLWGTLIALLYRGQPVLGCIHQPVLNQLVVGDGTATTLNGTPVLCRPTTRVADATLLTCDWLTPAQYQDGAAFERLARSARFCRTWGDAGGYLLLATGWADIVVDPIMNPWDIAALVPVIRGASGVITDWNGGPAYPAKSTVAAATSELHAAVLAALSS
jgi:histidinol phosphatase-like enzyme (inositol monophosphatase family)